MDDVPIGKLNHQSLQYTVAAVAIQTLLQQAEWISRTDLVGAGKLLDAIERIVCDRFENNNLFHAEYKEAKASICAAGGNLPAASALHLEGLSVRRQSLGKHVKVATSLGYLAALDLRMNNLSHAYASATECLELRLELLPAGHPEIASAHYIKGRVLQALARYEESESLMRQSLEARQSLFGHQHELVAQCMCGLAEALQGRGKWVEAGSLLREAEVLSRAGEIGSMRFKGKLLILRANNAWQLGKFVLSLDLCSQAALVYPAMSAVTHTEDAILVSECAVRSARAKRALCRYGEATSDLDAVTGFFEGLISKTSLAYSELLLERAELASRMGNVTSADSALAQALTVRQRYGIIAIALLI